MADHVVSGVAAHRTTIYLERVSPFTRDYRYQAACVDCSWSGTSRATPALARLDADEHARSTTERQA